MGDRQLDLTRTTLSVIAIVALMAGTAWILRPFLAPLLWAAMIVVATWPLLLALERRLGGRRTPAVVVMSTALVLVVVAPLYLGVATVLEHSDRIVALARTLSASSVPLPPDWVEEVPVFGRRLAESWRGLAGDPQSLSARVAPYVGTALQWFAAHAGSIGATVVELLLTVVISAILYSGGEAAALGIRRFSQRLAGDRGELAVELAGKAIRAVALGVIVTAVVQSAMAGVGLAVAGIPGALLLSAVVFVLCIAQIGALVVLVPAVAWLYWSGSTGWGTALLVWTVIVSAVDNVLRPVLIRRGANLPLLLIFAGVIGGLIGFGVIGLFIGPVVLAVAYTLLEAWIVGPPRATPLPAATPETPRRAG